VQVKKDSVRIAAPEDESGGLGLGGIIGIVVVALLLLLAMIALVVYRRRKAEEDQLRMFAGNQAPEADLEDPPTVDLLPEQVPVPAPQMAPEVGAPAEAPEEDDESSAPSVWSESDNEDALDELHDDHEDPGATAGSALAAMGAASTVTARIGAASPVGSGGLV